MTYSAIARSICQPRDKQAKAAPVRTGRAARVRVGRHDSPARQRDILMRLADRVNAASDIVTVAGQLRQRGADDDLVRRYASPVGRKVAAAVRTEGAQPEQVALAVAGRKLVAAFGYADRWTVDAVIEAYELADPNSPVKGRKAPRIRLTDLIGA